MDIAPTVGTVQDRTVVDEHMIRSGRGLPISLTGEGISSVKRRS